MSREIESAVQANDTVALGAALASSKRLAPKLMNQLLRDAAGAGHDEILRMLLNHFKPIVSFEVINFAAVKHRLGALRVLREAGADLNARYEETGETALHRCVGMGDPELVRTFADLGADLNDRDNRGRTPLMALAGAMYTMEDRARAMEALRKMRESRNEPLDGVAPVDGEGCMRLMVERGADASVKDDEGNDALDYYRLTSRRRRQTPEDPRISALLREWGAVGDEATFNLFTAMLEGDLQAMQSAIVAGADVNRIPADEDRTPLSAAAENGALEMMDLLIAAGADVNRADRFSRPLIRAAEGGHLAAVKRLVEAGAGVLLRHPRAPASDCPPMTPYEAAVNFDRKELAAYLKTVGGHRGTPTTLEPGIHSWENFAEVLIQADLRTAAAALANLTGTEIRSTTYGAAIEPGPRAYILAKARKSSWCNVFQLAPPVNWLSDSKAAGRFAAEYATAAAAPTRYIGYSDTSDAAMSIRFEPDGTSKRKIGRESDNDWLVALAKKEKFIAGAYAPLHLEQNGGELALSGHAAEAFDGVAFLTI